MLRYGGPSPIPGPQHDNPNKLPIPQSICPLFHPARTDHLSPVYGHCRMAGLEGRRGPGTMPWVRGQAWRVPQLCPQNKPGVGAGLSHLHSRV